MESHEHSHEQVFDKPTIQAEVEDHLNGKGVPDYGLGPKWNSTIHEQVLQTNKVFAETQKSHDELVKTMGEFLRTNPRPRSGEIVNPNVSFGNNFEQKKEKPEIVIDTTAEEVLEPEPSKVEVKHLNKDEELNVASKPEAIKVKSLLSDDAKKYLELLAFRRKIEGLPAFSSSINQLKWVIEDNDSVQEILTKIEDAEKEGAFNDIEKRRLLEKMGFNQEQEENKAEKIEINFKIGDKVYWKVGSLQTGPHIVKGIDHKGGWVYFEGKVAPRRAQEVFSVPEEKEEAEKITEEDIEGLYNDVVKTIGEKPFLLNEFVTAKGGDWFKIEQGDKDFLKNILNILVSRGKLTKSGIFYSVAPKGEAEVFGNNPDNQDKKENNPDVNLQANNEQNVANNINKQDQTTIPETVVDNSLNQVPNPKAGNEPVLDNTFYGPLQEKLVEDVNLNLKNAQIKYAEAQISYKNKNLENNKWLTKIRAGLGIEKTTAEVLSKISPKNLEEEIQKMREAQEEYISAKKAKMEEILSAPVTEDEIKKYGLDGVPKEKIVHAIYKNRAVEQSEKEWDSLQKRITEMTPTKEKSRMMKAFEYWSKKPLTVRLTALPVLIGAGIAFAPGLGFAAGGITAGLAYAGVRTARGVGGYFGSKYAGKGFDVLAEKSNAEAHEKNSSYYVSNLNSNNFVELEKIDMENREREAQRKQQQRVAKAIVMMGAGAGVGVATGYAESLASNAVFPGAGHVDVPSAPTVKSTGFWQGLKNKIIEPDRPTAPKAPGVPKDINLKTGMLKAEDLKVQNQTEFAPAKVELSSRGFIQTFDDLKKQLASQYEGKTMPKGVKEFIDKPSTKLAEDYGFYDAKKGLSGMGLKGEHLSINSKGEVSLDHLNGKSEIIDTTAEHKFHGKMLDTNKPKADIVPPKTAKVPLYGDDLADKGGVKVEPIESDISKYHIIDNSEAHTAPVVHAPEVPKVSETPNNFDMISQNKTFHVEVSEIAGTKQIMVNHVKIAEQIPAAKDGNGTMLKLLDKYQDGKKYAPLREAYTKVIDQTIPVNKENILPINFENGRIHVIKNVVDGKTNATVMLNGKEIAKGYLESKSPNLKLISGIPKGGLLFGDTVYERALKTAERVIKTLDYNQLTTK